MNIFDLLTRCSNYLRIHIVLKYTGYKPKHTSHHLPIQKKTQSNKSNLGTRQSSFA